MTETVLTVNGLCKSFPIETGFFEGLKRRLRGIKPSKLEALKDVSLEVKRGETLGILGESGSGKSTLARVLMGIYPPESGSAELMGENLFAPGRCERLKMLKKMQMVFQDPFGSLDPRMNVRQIISEPLKIHNLMPAKKDADSFFKNVLEGVGLDTDVLNRYPSEFSGGQRQRIGICRALILSPDLLIADEAVSALDVSVQAQILDLLIKQKEERKLAMIFISHDVAVVRQISDRIALLFKGRLVEEMPADKLLSSAVHPYTRHLLDAALFLREGKNAGSVSETDPLPLPDGFKGCCYKNCCPKSSEACEEAPALETIGPGHKAACWHAV